MLNLVRLAGTALLRLIVKMAKSLTAFCANLTARESTIGTRIGLYMGKIGVLHSGI